MSASPPAVASPAASAPAPTSAEPSALVVGTPGNEGLHNVRHHYLWSNERRHDLFFADVAELGGGYLGVGGDQNYTLAAAASASVLWLVDLDVMVVRMHRLYAALLATAETPAAFLALLADGSATAAAKVHAAIDSYHQDQPSSERQELRALYAVSRSILLEHLRRTAEYRWAHRSVTWLGDPVLYARMRNLAQKHLIVARLGDLNGSQTLMQIAQAAQAAQVPISVLYLSNAESWFAYNQSFRRNLVALPWAARGVVLRTVKSAVLPYPHGDIWHYNVQRASDFTARLSGPGYRAIEDAMLTAQQPLAKDKQAPRGLSHTGFEPAAKLSAPLVTQLLRAPGLITRPASTRAPLPQAPVRASR
ncbi:MAG: hypothetical protein KA244_05940 [Deltaproteobacteria bacterium]|nr:hypothetical protein [Deltaproteobacteria bacterium]